MPMRKVFIVTGQTATGKTAYALKLAEKYNGELVNCDSRQVYKKLDIITGKDLPKNAKFVQTNLSIKWPIGYYEIPNTENSKKTKIWLYDIVDPKSPFSSYDWVQCAIPVIIDIIRRGKTPIIVGGSYLYLYHLLFSVDSETIPPNWQLREELKNKSVVELQSILKKSGKKIIKQLNYSDMNNPQRLIRKIELSLSGQKISKVKFSPNSKIMLGQKLGLEDIHTEIVAFRYQDKEKQKKHIYLRVKKRLDNGAIDEMKKLLQQGYSKEDAGLKTIGYQQLIKLLSNFSTKNEAIEEWVNKEIQYAKRQITFMKKNRKIVWKVI